MGQRNEIQRMSVDAFARKAYERLTEGAEQLPAEQRVDAVLNVADMIKRAVEQVREQCYAAAEQGQGEVMGDRASVYKRATESVLRATATGDLEQVDAALEASIEASLRCKEAAVKLRHIRNRGFEGYDASKEMAAYMKRLDTTVDREYRVAELVHDGGNGR